MHPRNRKTRPLKANQHLGIRDVERLTSAAMKAIGRFSDIGKVTTVVVDIGGGRLLHVRISESTKSEFKPQEDEE